MITDAAHLKSSGLPIGDLPQARIDTAIQEAEYDVILPALGEENYTTLLTATGPIIDGGVLNGNHIVGFRTAANYLAYSRLLRHTASATNFGTVQKRDEHSTPADPFADGKYYEGVGINFLRQCIEAAGWTMGQLRTIYTWKI